MELTKEVINKNKDNIEGLIGYSVIVSEIEDNITINPDITIESCKSLIEGLCKKALELVSDKYNSDKKLRGTCEDQMPFLIKTAFNEVYSNGLERDLHNSLYSIINGKVRTQRFLKKAQTELLKNGKKAIDKITAIRHNRGDISHGRIYPKIQESEIHLAKSIASITDGICSFMILEFAQQYAEKIALLGKLIYAEQGEYNEWLDKQNDKLTTKIDFSFLLFKSSNEKYEEIYYLDYLESIESKDDDENDTIISTEKVEKEIKNLTNTFNEKSFWTEEKLKALLEFVEAENLILETTKTVIEEFLFTDKEPFPDNVKATMAEKPNLLAFRAIKKELTDKIVEFAKYLNQ